METATLEVVINAFVASPVEVEVLVDQFTPSTGSGSFSAYRKQTVALGAGERKTIPFPKLSAAGSYRVKIVPKSGRETNQILWDDLAWFSSSDTARGALLVSESSPEKLGLDRIPSLKIAHAIPDQFESEVLPELEDGESGAHRYELIIFHRYIPPFFPPVNALFVAPVVENSLFGVYPAESRSEVTRWLEAHPVTSYLNMPALSLPSMSPLQTPFWAKEFIATTRGTAAFLGVRNEKQYVVLGFEIFPYRAAYSPVISILTLNITKWLSSGGVGMEYLQVGAGYSISADESVRLVGPEATERLDPAEGVVVPETPGFLVVQGGEEPLKVMPVNFFHEGESDLRDIEVVKISELRKRVSGVSKDSLQPLEDVLAWFVLSLLVLDLLWQVGGFLRRRQRKAAVEGGAG
jgi:hypothetical protein